MSDYKPESPVEEGEPPRHGLLAEYESPVQLLDASKKVRDAGFTRWETFAPFPIRDLPALRRARPLGRPRHEPGAAHDARLRARHLATGTAPPHNGAGVSCLGMERLKADAVFER